MEEKLLFEIAAILAQIAKMREEGILPCPEGENVNLSEMVSSGEGLTHD